MATAPERREVGAWGAASCHIVLGDAKLMAKYNPVQFIQEVRQEVAKVTWPTWKEVWITTIMVLVMVTLAAIFFLLTDQVIGWLMQVMLGGNR
jgi:preprotein translocase subunit SecE